MPMGARSDLIRFIIVSWVKSHPQMESLQKPHACFPVVKIVSLIRANLFGRSCVRVLHFGSKRNVHEDHRYGDNRKREKFHCRHTEEKVEENIEPMLTVILTYYCELNNDANDMRRALVLFHSSLVPATVSVRGRRERDKLKTQASQHSIKSTTTANAAHCCLCRSPFRLSLDGVYSLRDFMPTNIDEDDATHVE